MPAKFFEAEVRSTLKGKRKLSAFLDKLVLKYRKEIIKIHLTYIFCNDEHLLKINRQFLNHDYLTDIITFDLSEKEAELTGEIYISVDRVKENAMNFKTHYIHELHRVIFHGVLHLCGFKDKKIADKKAIRLLENKCLRAYFKEN